MLHDQTFAFIGSGAMGEAMIKGLITQANLPPQQIAASDPRPERGVELEQKYGVHYTTDNLAAVNGAKIVVLSVKPQVLHPVLTQLAGHIAPEALVLSIVAGARTEVITNLLLHKAVVRSMPNTPAQIGMGMTVWTCPAAMSQLHRDQAKAVLDEAKIRADAGLVGPSEVATSQVFLAEQEQAVLDREEALNRASNAFASLIGARPEKGQMERFRPTDSPPLSR